jgi:oxygen-independent coproporphyrinogen-3 oxidase
VQFSEDFTGEDYKRCLQSAASLTGEPLAIYIHVPFCEHGCLYCGCHVIPTLKRSVAVDYPQQLTREIRILSDFFKGERPAKVLHIGRPRSLWLSARKKAERPSR